MQTNLGRRWSRRILAATVLTGGVLAGRGFTQSPLPGMAPASPEPTLVDSKSKDYGVRPVAYIYDNVAITRADLAEFLIARGGYEKVELLVNKMIIEEEAKRKGITVTTQEMEAAFAADLQISNPPIRKEDFINLILPKYNKTYYEWMEDVVRPRLILGKMCVDRIKVGDDDLKKIFEREYGEKRVVKIIIWPKGDQRTVVDQVWDKIRKSESEFDRVARSQANPSLASTAGEIKPIARFQISDDKDKIVEKMAFALNEGEVSQVFETNQGLMVMKVVQKVPADAKVKFDDVKERLRKEAYEVKQGAEIPLMFAELAKKANVKVLLNGPPSQWRFDKSARELAEDVIRQQTPQPATAAPVQPAAAQQPISPPSK
ncbi:peptidylprolyl isomerase [Limnoglobus roseus]|uniref:peptidylprolyl isomerase n=1 Tax=Limnoglobus roseus TaxID=2598579 RepID=A0A5C1AB68_9BACT|nr:peptidylprolyl isomerase [Limnoglobus roseus]QEL15266.1 peptidyl-prolyl cis-trans isomerase [Limnoglobus roseus]